MAASHVRKRSAAALLLIDLINHFEFPDGLELLRNAKRIAPAIRRLKHRARLAGMATIYVNDNFGQWRSDANKLVSYCLRPSAVGREFVSLVKPDEEDYFVLKPMHSAFYQSPLEVLLDYLGASSVIISGISTNSCVVCSAHDADMRKLKLVIASDCCAASTRSEHEQALHHIEKTTRGKVLKSSSIRFSSLK